MDLGRFLASFVLESEDGHISTFWLLLQGTWDPCWGLEGQGICSDIVSKTFSWLRILCQRDAGRGEGRYLLKTSGVFQRVHCLFDYLLAVNIL